MKIEEFSTPTLIGARLGAAFLAFVAFLQPLEGFAAQCKLKSPPVCLDATPCKSVHDPMYPNDPAKTVEVCLSNAAKAGALTTSATCWQYTSTYDCLDPNAVSPYHDTCAPIAADTTNCPSYQELSSKCSEPLTASGVCPSFDVTYQCMSKPGQQYTEQNCTGLTLCSGGICTPGPAEKNSAFAKVAATAEISRQAGVYADNGNGTLTDPNAIRVFTGVAGNCSQNTLGASDCCKPNAQGANYTNVIITQELMKYGWNYWIKNIVGSNYTYDTLFDDVSGFVTKAITTMSSTIKGWVDNAPPMVGPPPPLVGPPAPGVPNATAQPVSGMNTAGYTIGGYAGTFAAGQTMSSSTGAKITANANFQATGVITAIASTGGTVAGSMIAGSAMAGYAAGTEATTVTFTGGAEAGLGFALGPVLVAALVIAIVMALVACMPDEAKLQMKLGAGICHWVGSYCSYRDVITGNCMTRNQDYCCFNGKLPLIIQEQGRPQIGKSWGVAGSSTDCSGFTVTELNSLNFAAMDFSAFVATIQNVMPSQSDLTNQMTTRTQAFFNNNTNPTATQGVLVPSAPTVTPPALTTANNMPAAPALAACSVSMTEGVPAPDGSIVGTFSVTACNANANLIWTYIGTCAAIPKYTSAAQVPTTDIVATNASGAATFTRTMPASCLTQGAPSTYNAWKFLVTDPAAGYLGAINAPWQ